MKHAKDALRPILGALLLASPAAAQDAPGNAASGQAVFQEELSVTGRALASEGAAVTVIDRETIEASNARTVAELVRRVAGVQLISNGSRGATTARIRGGDTNFTLVLLDGIPLNNPTDVEGGSFNLSSLPLAHVDRIEVARGPHSYYFGSSAMAGVINIVSRRGRGPKPSFEVEAAGGESLVASSAAFSGSTDHGDYFLGAGWEREDERIADESFEQTHLMGNVHLPAGGRSTVHLSGRFTDWRADDYPEASGGPVFGSGELRTSERRQLSLGARWSLAAGDWRHTVMSSVDQQRADVESPGVAPQVPPSVEDTRYTRWRAGWLTEVGNGGPLRFSGGADVEREEARNDSTLFLPPFLGGDVAGDYGLERTTPGAFAELAAERGPLLVEAGVRADLPEGLDTQWSPRLALRYRLGESGLVVRTSWSQAFKLPSFFALASPAALGGNPDLLPEETTGLDLGFELEARSGKVTAGLTLFSNRYENLIDFDFELFTHLNRATVEAEGVELSIAWNPFPALALRTDLYWQDLRDRGSDQPILNQPEWLASAVVEWRPADSLTLALDGRYVGGSLDVQIPVPGRFSVDAYTAFDLAATWTWSERWQLTARVENLGDESYEHFIGFPEPERSARVGLRYRLQ